MAIYCVTYDLKAPGKDYKSVHEYLEKYNHCKKLESFWLLDTKKSASDIRDDLARLTDNNDIIFVAELKKHWASTNFMCAEWLNQPTRNWN